MTRVRGTRRRDTRPACYPTTPHCTGHVSWRFVTRLVAILDGGCCLRGEIEGDKCGGQIEKHWSICTGQRDKLNLMGF